METQIRRTPMIRAIEAEHGKRGIDVLLRERVDAGMTVRQIATEWDVHYTVVYDWLAAFGITPPGHAPRKRALAGAV